MLHRDCLLVSFSLFFIVACGADKFRATVNGAPRTDTQQGEGDPFFGRDGDPKASPTPTPLTCSSQTFQQQAVANPLLDILIVFDVSGSMTNKLGALGTQFSSLMNTITNRYSNLDYRIGVMMAHIDGTHSGQLWTPDQIVCANPIVIAGVGPISVANQEALSCKLLNRVVPSPDDKGESGFGSVLTAVGSNLAQNRLAGFFRENAGLAVIFVADENELCNNRPAYLNLVKGLDSIPDVAEYDYIKGASGAALCAQATPANTFNALKALQGNKPLVIASIVKLTGSANDIGWGYTGTPESEYGQSGIAELAGNNGIKVQISSSASVTYDAALGEIGSKVIGAFTQRTSFPVMASTQRVDSVKVAGTLKPYVYVPQIQEVQLSPAVAGGPGDSIEILSCHP